MASSYTSTSYFPQTTKEKIGAELKKAARFKEKFTARRDEVNGQINATRDALIKFRIELESIKITDTQRRLFEVDRLHREVGIGLKRNNLLADLDTAKDNAERAIKKNNGTHERIIKEIDLCIKELKKHESDQMQYDQRYAEDLKKFQAKQTEIKLLKIEEEKNNSSLLSLHGLVSYIGLKDSKEESEPPQGKENSEWKKEERQLRSIYGSLDSVYPNRKFLAEIKASETMLAEYAKKASELEKECVEVYEDIAKKENKILTDIKAQEDKIVLQYQKFQMCINTNDPDQINEAHTQLKDTAEKVFVDFEAKLDAERKHIFLEYKQAEDKYGIYQDEKAKKFDDVIKEQASKIDLLRLKVKECNDTMIAAKLIGLLRCAIEKNVKFWNGKVLCSLWNPVIIVNKEKYAVPTGIKKLHDILKECKDDANAPATLEKITNQKTIVKERLAASGITRREATSNLYNLVEKIDSYLKEGGVESFQQELQKILPREDFKMVQNDIPRLAKSKVAGVR